MATVKLKVNSSLINDFSGKLQTALEKCGLQAEAYAKTACPVDTGRLRGSISHSVVGNTMYVGTNTEYALYIEMGTGKHSANGGGTNKEKWVYMDEFGQFHTAHPQRPRAFLKPSVANHLQEYSYIIAETIKGK